MMLRCARAATRGLAAGPPALRGARWEATKASAPAAPALSDVRHMTFHHEMDIPLRWGDMDSYGHVNNTTYAVYLETSRVELLNELYRAAGLGETMPNDPTGLDFAPIVAELQLKYVSTMEYPDTIVCSTCITHISDNTFWVATSCRSKRTGATTVVGLCRTVFLDYRTGKRASIPPAMREAMEKFRTETPAAASA